MKTRLLKLTLIGLATIGLASCGEKTDEGGVDVAQIAEAAKVMSNDELIAKAKAETGKFIAYGTTSRISNAVDNFVTKYGEQLGLTKDNAKGTKMDDSSIYATLGIEYAAKDNSNAASFVLLQDSATLAQYRKSSNMLTNYISNQFATNVDSDALVPLAHQYINKLFIWNNTKGESAPKFNNVWDLTEEAYKGKIYFKSPTAEQVNMNFLMTLTSDTWVKKMEAAYKAKYNKDYTPEGKLINASYAWIDAFLRNADTASYTSDTKMAAGVAKEENNDKVGLFVLSKLRDKSVTSENLTVGAWEEGGITPFAGFMYSIYAQIASKGPRPYTAMLFTNYLMTEEGFAPWKEAIGGYSSNKEIKEFDGDKPLSFYKNCLVLEDGEYISANKATLGDWINGILADKAK